MIVLNSVYETARQVDAVAEEFKCSHTKQNSFSSTQGHLNSLFHFLKGILAKL